MPTFTTTRRVEFRDTDAAGLMHFSAFFTAMESAEHEFLRSLGLSVAARDEQGELGWPRIAARCEYRNPARFEDVLTIEVKLTRLGAKSATYEFEFTRDGARIANGEMTSVYCRQGEDGMPRSVAIPEWFAKRLQGADT